MSGRWSLTICSLVIWICGTAPAPTSPNLQTSSLAIISEAPDGQVYVMPPSRVSTHQSRNEPAAGSSVSASQITSTVQKSSFPDCSGCKTTTLAASTLFPPSALFESTNSDGSVISVGPSGHYVGSSHIPIGQASLPPVATPPGIPIAIASRKGSITGPIALRKSVPLGSAPFPTKKTVMESSGGSLLHSSVLNIFPTPEGSQSQESIIPKSSGTGVETPRPGISSAFPGITKQPPNPQHAGSPLSSRIQSPPAVIQSTGSSLKPSEAKTFRTQIVGQSTIVQCKPGALQDNSSLSLSNSREQSQSMLSKIRSASPATTTQNILSHSSTINQAISTQGPSTKELSRASPESIKSNEISPQLQPSRGFASPSGPSFEGSTISGAHNASQLLPLGTTKSPLSGLPNPLAPSSLRRSSLGGMLNSFKPSSPSIPTPRPGGVLSTFAPGPSTSAQSSTPSPTTTETILPPEASIQTLTSGAYLSDQWITTIPPGSPSATVVPVIIPPGLHNPIVLWNAIPGPPPGGKFPTPPHLEIDAPKVPCIRIFGLKVGSCPSKRKGKHHDSGSSDPSPKPDANPSPSPDPTQETKSRSSEAPSSTCTSSMATITSVSCASMGISSSCTTAFTTKEGCDVTGSLTSTASCVSQTTISGKTVCCPSTTIKMGSTVCAFPSLTVEDVLKVGTIPQTSIGSAELMEKWRSYVAMQSGRPLAAGGSHSPHMGVPSSGFIASAASSAANSSVPRPFGSASPASHPFTALSSASSTMAPSSLHPPSSIPLASPSNSSIAESRLSGMRPSSSPIASATVSNPFSSAPSQSESRSSSVGDLATNSSLLTASQSPSGSLSLGTAVSASLSSTSGQSTGLPSSTVPASSSQTTITSASLTILPSQTGVEGSLSTGFLSITSLSGSLSLSTAVSTSLSSTSGQSIDLPNGTAPASSSQTTIISASLTILSSQTGAEESASTSIPSVTAPTSSLQPVTTSAAQSTAAQPPPTAQCFPYHDVNDLQDTDPDLQDFCTTNFTLQDGAIWDSGSDEPAGPSEGKNGPTDPTLAARNNNLFAGFTVGPGAPEVCQEVFQPGRRDLANVACRDSFSQIVSDCPYNGGKLVNGCGEWWLMTCPLEDNCPVGCPGGEYAVGDSECGTPWPPPGR